MKPTINLHEGEQVLFECQPKNNLIGYLFLTRYIRHIVVLTILVVIAFSDATQSMIENAVLAHSVAAVIAFVVISIMTPEI